MDLGLFCYWEGGMCVISWCSKWPSDLNAMPQKPFLPQSLSRPDLLSVIGRFCLFSMQQDCFVCFQCNLWYLAGAQCLLCQLLCGDEWIFLLNLIHRCTVQNDRNTFETKKVNYTLCKHREKATLWTCSHSHVIIYGNLVRTPLAFLFKEGGSTLASVTYI